MTAAAPKPSQPFIFCKIPLRQFFKPFDLFALPLDTKFLTKGFSNPALIFTNIINVTYFTTICSILRYDFLYFHNWFTLIFALNKKSVPETVPTARTIQETKTYCGTFLKNKSHEKSVHPCSPGCRNPEFLHHSYANRFDRKCRYVNKELQRGRPRCVAQARDLHLRDYRKNPARRKEEHTQHRCAGSSQG